MKKAKKVKAAAKRRSKKVRASTRRKSSAISAAEIKLICDRMADDYAGKDWDDELGQDTAEALRKIVG